MVVMVVVVVVMKLVMLMVVAVYLIFPIILVISLPSAILPWLLPKQQGPFDAVTAGAGGFGSPPRLVETRPGQASPVSPGQNLAFPQLIYEFDFDFDLPTVVRSE